MKLKTQHLLFPYLAPAGDTSGGTAPLDRGDDFVPTGDDAADSEVKKPEPKVEPEVKTGEPKVDTTDPDAKDTLTDEERKAGKYVPRDRLNEVSRKARAKEEAYQNEIQQLRKSLDANKVDANIEQIDTKIAELDGKYDDLMMDGEKEKAKAVKAELRKYEQARSQMVSQAYSVQAQLAAIEQYRYDNALEALEQQYDVLNEATDVFDADVTTEIAELMSFHQSKGLSKADALRKAAHTLLGPPKTKDAATDANALRAQRSTEARKSAADTINKQPPEISKVGIDSDKLGGGTVKPKDLLKMSQDQFAKLDEETLSKLRGDEYVGEGA